MKKPFEPSEGASVFPDPDEYATGREGSVVSNPLQSDGASTSTTPRISPSRANSHEAQVDISLNINEAASAGGDGGSQAAAALQAGRESWGQWSWRHLYNGFIFFSVSMYQVVHTSTHKDVDEKVVDHMSNLYIPSPPAVATEQQGRIELAREHHADPEQLL